MEVTQEKYRELINYIDQMKEDVKLGEDDINSEDDAEQICRMLGLSILEEKEE